MKNREDDYKTSSFGKYDSTGTRISTSYNEENNKKVRKD